MKGATVACAVVRDAPPMLMLAEDLEVLQRALARLATLVCTCELNEEAKNQ